MILLQSDVAAIGILTHLLADKKIEPQETLQVF